VTGRERTIEGTNVVDIHIGVGQATRRGGIREELWLKTACFGEVVGLDFDMCATRSVSSSRLLGGLVPSGSGLHWILRALFWAKKGTRRE